MKAKQLRFRNILISSELLIFKGFVLTLKDSIVNTTFTVSKAPIPNDGTLSSLIVANELDYSTLVDISYTAEQVHKKDFEIVVDFPSEVTFDNIKCICGPDISNHFKHLHIEYKEATGDWKFLNNFPGTPFFSQNNISNDLLLTKDTIVLDGLTNIQHGVKNTLSLSYFSYIGKNHISFNSGKHFIEFTFLNSIKNVGSNYFLALGLLESNSQYRVFGTSSSGMKGYFIGTATGGISLTRANGSTDQILSTIGNGYPNNVIWPETTVGLFIDLDNNKLKYVVDGVFESSWIDIVKSSPTQSFFFVSQIRNMGSGFEFIYNYPPKKTYTDLTADYKQDHFFLPKSWQLTRAFISKKSSVDKEKAKRNYIPYSYTMRELGTLEVDIKYIQATREYIWRVPFDSSLNWGYGYFKNSVFIDYPPKQPTSKRVLLFSINENTVQQQTWSNALTGEFEFKNVKMKQPYLIITYDSDEDYNGVVVGPVYPTLMPKYEGVDLTIR